MHGGQRIMDLMCNRLMRPLQPSVVSTACRSIEDLTGYRELRRCSTVPRSALAGRTSGRSLTVSMASRSASTWSGKRWWCQVRVWSSGEAFVRLFTFRPGLRSYCSASFH